MGVVALLFVFVFPARTLLAQRQQTDKQRTTLELLQEQSRRLEEESRRLQSDAEIERMAREQYGFVYPGERPYVIVPPPTTAPPAPATSARAWSSPRIRPVSSRSRLRERRGVLENALEPPGVDHVHLHRRAGHDGR